MPGPSHTYLSVARRTYTGTSEHVPVANVGDGVREGDDVRKGDGVSVRGRGV